jgi:SAM-dependent methyltransferase
MISDAYKKLCTEFYDLDKPVAPEDEVNFYFNFLNEIKGPILEPMCGSGRLLIPLLERGLEVEGTDNSVEMLNSCRNKTLELKLQPILHQCDLLDLALPHCFDAIIIPVGSFQLFPNREIALQVLQVLHKHLKCGGFLLLDTFIPWEAVTKSEATDIRQVQGKDGSTIKITSHSKRDRLKQVDKGTSVYEKFVGGKCIESENEELFVTWYYPYEMELFLEKAGFQKIVQHSPNYSSNPDGIVYQAFKGEV